MPHVRSLAARIEDPAACLASDRVSPRAISGAMEERKPLIGEHPERYAIMPDVGRLSGTRKNRALAGVADDAETEPLRGYVEVRSHRESVIRDVVEQRGLVPSPIAISNELYTCRINYNFAPKSEPFFRIKEINERWNPE